MWGPVQGLHQAVSAVEHLPFVNSFVPGFWEMPVAEHHVWLRSACPSYFVGTCFPDQIAMTRLPSSASCLRISTAACRSAGSMLTLP